MAPMKQRPLEEKEQPPKRQPLEEKEAVMLYEFWEVDRAFQSHQVTCVREAPSADTMSSLELQRQRLCDAALQDRGVRDHQQRLGLINCLQRPASSGALRLRRLS